jgi:hypothetical protein
MIKSGTLRWVGHVRMGERRGAYKVLVGKPEGNNHLEDPGVNRGKMDLKETWDWIDLALDRDGCRALVNAEMNLDWLKTC